MALDILLINPNHGINTTPWGVLALANYLVKTHGYNVEVLDAGSLPEDEFFLKVEQYLKNVKLVGLTSFSTDTHFVKECVDFIKKIKPSCFTIIGGPHAVLKGEETCLYKNIDFVAYQDGEQTLAKLIGTVNSGKKDFSSIEGLIYKVDGDLIKNESVSPVELYKINYEYLPDRTISSFKNKMAVLTGRGCSFKCTFCYNAVCGQKWNPKSAVEIIEELRYVVDTYNPKLIYFRDENFFHSRDRIKEFIKLYKQEKFSFKWEANCRIGYFSDRYINDELIKDLEDINCSMLSFGVESGSDKILKYLKKGLKSHRVRTVVDKLKDSKIDASYSFLIGLPPETLDDYQATLDLVKYIIKTDKNAVISGPQYYRIYPGGELYDEIMANYTIEEPKSFEEWATVSADDSSSLNKNLTHPWIDKRYLLFTKYCDMMVLLAMKNLTGKSLLLNLWRAPFILLAKARVKYNFLAYCYDLYLYNKLFTTLLNIKEKTLKKRSFN